MKSAIIALIAISMFAVGFGFMGHMGMNGHMEVNGSHVNGTVNVTNGTMHGHGNVNGAEVTVNASKNETVVIISHQTPHGTMNKILTMLRNKENRTYVFHMLMNKTVNEKTRIMVKKQIINMIKENSEFRKQIIMNKTLLIQLIPKYKQDVERGVVKNITVKTQGNQTEMEVKVIVHKKILGFIPVNIEEEIVTNEKTAKIKRPWWAIFAI